MELSSKLGRTILTKFVALASIQSGDQGINAILLIEGAILDIKILAN